MEALKDMLLRERGRERERNIEGERDMERERERERDREEVRMNDCQFVTKRWNRLKICY
jgi:hypothetical protein